GGAFFGGEPLGVLIGRQDAENAAHFGMAAAAKLGTLNLVVVGGGRPEMDRYAHAGIGVLRNAQRNDFEGVDHVERADMGADVGGGGDVIRLRIARSAEPPDGVEEVGGPADEKHNHEDVDIPDEAVHVGAVP